MKKFTFNNKIISKRNSTPALITEFFLMNIIKVLCSSTEVSRRTLDNITRLFNSIDIKYFTSKGVSYETLINTIEMFIGLRSYEVDFSIDYIQMQIDNFIVNENNQSYVDDLLKPLIQTNVDKVLLHELESLDTSIDIELKFGKIIDTSDEIKSNLNNIDRSVGVDRVDNLNKLRIVVNNVADYFRETDAMDGSQKIIHTSDQDVYNGVLSETYKKIKDPGRVLKTGIKTLNEALGTKGGFSQGYYMFYATINSFKSAMLEQIARMIQKYNSEPYRKEFEKTGKRPTILFYSLENSVLEDTERMYKMYTGRDMSDNHSLKEAIESWNNAYGYGEDASIIDISFVYGQAGTVTPSDIRNRIEVLNNSNRNVIACIIDYFELLKAELEYARLEPRLQFVKNSDALLNISKMFDIPIISAHQLNRTAEAALNYARENGMTNLVNVLNSTHIGESHGIEKAVSFSAFMHREDFQGEEWFTMKMSKSRNKRSNIKTLVHPIKNGIVFEDDIHLRDTLSRATLEDTISLKDTSNDFRSDLNVNKIIDTKNRETTKMKQNERMEISDNVIDKLEKKVSSFIDDILDASSFVNSIYKYEEKCSNGMKYYMPDESYAVNTSFNNTNFEKVEVGKNVYYMPKSA